jgi:DNA-binding transcriptional LysR family regulator
MDSLSGIAIFVQVADTRSFTEAGRQLGVSSSAVGKSIARIEQRLGVRLFHRSTRSITLTAEGALFLERCRRILGEVEAAEVELSHVAGNPRGKLRLSVPQLNATLMPALSDFMRRYPEIALEIDMSDRMVDIIEEGFDAVIRTGEQHDSRLVSRRLGACPQVLVGTPAYFAKHGLPQHPRDLVRHQCLQHKFPLSGKLEVWPLQVAPPELMPPLPASMIGNNIETLTYAALQDMGIVFVPTFTVHGELQSGRLRRVLDDYLDQTVTFSMMWPASKHASPKLRVLIDYLGEHLFPSV